MKNEIPLFFPLQEIKAENNRHKLNDILTTWIPRNNSLFNVIVDRILVSHKPEAIIALLEEYKEMQGLRMNNENMYKLAMIERDLKKLECPIIPGNHNIFYRFKHTRPYEKWHVFDIEREYFQIHVIRGEFPKIMPKEKYLKKEVYGMLNLLLECNVIYDYESKALFVNDFKGELNSYFRNYKKIRVQTL